MAIAPISFRFVATGALNYAKGNLYKFSPSREKSPDWSEGGGNIATREISAPITDRSFWNGRFALCELTLENSNGERLTINDAVVAISRSKNIVSTQMVGFNGTVKEFINEGDFSLNIVVGVAAVENGEIIDAYPEEGLRQLREFLDDDKPLKCYSAFLDVFEISQIVVTGFSVSQETHSNYQSVSISAVSDEDYNVFSTDY